MSIKKQMIRFLWGGERGVLRRIESSYWNGLRLATFGGVVAFCGAGVITMGAENVGRILVVTGIIGSAAGIVCHFVLVVSWFFKGR
jgi:hypothetical protein